MQNLLENYHADAVATFRSYKKLAERAIEQLDDDQFFAGIDRESNSIAILVKHVAGNLHSRWTDFLTTDGEKPDRDRDREFAADGEDRQALMNFWESGWDTLFASLEPLTTDDLSRTIAIRGQPHSVPEAINRQMTHYAYHVGQIVFLAKHLKSESWKTLSVPRGRSADYNRFIEEGGDHVKAVHRMDPPIKFMERPEKDRS